MAWRFNKKIVIFLILIGFFGTPVFALAAAPKAITYSATEITESTALLAGTIDPLGATDTKRWFEWGTTPSFGDRTSRKFQKNYIQYVTSRIRGLDPDTTYYYRIVAESSQGKSNGEVKSFKTSREEDSEAQGGGEGTQSNAGQTSGTQSNGQSSSGNDTSGANGTSDRNGEISATAPNENDTLFFRVEQSTEAVAPGEPFELSVEYRNHGTTRIEEIVFRAILPAGIEYAPNGKETKVFSEEGNILSYTAAGLPAELGDSIFIPLKANEDAKEGVYEVIVLASWKEGESSLWNDRVHRVQVTVSKSAGVSGGKSLASVVSAGRVYLIHPFLGWIIFGFLLLNAILYFHKRRERKKEEAKKEKKEEVETPTPKEQGSTLPLLPKEIREKLFPRRISEITKKEAPPENLPV